MSRNIKLTIEYEGTNYHGWQIQAKGHKTIQGQIENALKKIFKKDIRLYGSGRTDSGVHAFGQVANFKVNTSLSLNDIQKAINANTPDDISIIDIEEVPMDFHSQYSAKSKIYRYIILNRQAPSVRDRNFCLHYPYKLNLALMRREAAVLVGRKDFRSFQASDPRSSYRDKNTIRTVKNISIHKRGDYIFVDIEADGFLYKMVRNIVGTLLEIGRGKLPKGSMEMILLKKDRSAAGDTAKAKGLVLLKVLYS